MLGSVAWGRSVDLYEFVCRQGCSRACSGSIHLNAFWLRLLMEDLHCHRAEKHGQEASSNTELIVIRAKLSLPVVWVCVSVSRVQFLCPAHQ